MASFDDYHRTVVGYHGTTLSVALRLVSRVTEFVSSERDYDWLGRGIYFREYAPKQALNFARIRQRRLKEKKNKSAEEERRANDSLAVVACMIRLGFCLDLTEPDNVEYLGDVFDSYKKSREASGEALPKNTRHYRKLDRAVFEYAYELIAAEEPSRKVDTARGVYVSKDGARRVWEGSWISKDTHIQLCVRNPANILGIWLHYPNNLEVKNACEAFQTDHVLIQPKNSESKEVAQGDAEHQAD